MTRSYSEYRDAVHEVIAAGMTKTPLGSGASFDQLGDSRRQLVARLAEQIADELVLMHDEKWKLPSERYDRDMRDYSEPGAYDTDTDDMPPSSMRTNTGGEKGLFS
jgi:hypothetical protein